MTRSAVRTILDSKTIARIVVVLHDVYPLEREANVTWIESRNRGYASGLNLAVRSLLVHGDIQHVFAMNPDVHLISGDIEKLYEQHLRMHAAATFPVLREQGKLVSGYRFSGTGALKVVQQDPEWHSGACFVLSLEAWKSLQGFDESYFHYFEDYDLCLRLRQAGMRVHQATEVVLEHSGKSGADYPATALPLYAVRNHLIALDRAERLGLLSFLNVISRHFLYLFRWEKGWRGIPGWLRGIQEYISLRRRDTGGKI
jgi:GT2 family glycosyltransferase